jgi:hypothetical protein
MPALGGGGGGMAAPLGTALYWTVQTIAPSAGSVVAVTDTNRASDGMSRW